MTFSFPIYLLLRVFFFSLRSLRASTRFGETSLCEVSPRIAPLLRSVAPGGEPPRLRYSSPAGSHRFASEPPRSAAGSPPRARSL